MSRFFPHTSYAEDQPLPRVILTTHVVTRAVAVGSAVGVGVAAVRQAVPPWRGPDAFSRRLVRASSAGALCGLGLGVVAAAGRMYGRDLVEWQDRSWRLMENRGQLEVDDWTYLGMAAGVGTAWGAGTLRGMGPRGVVGAAGAGSVAGFLAWAAWRLGLNGGKYKEKPKEGDL
ncbi:uncharacterized protein MAM_02214 [Metarhizium album ARSEF 1941]|uniref:ATP release protein n=1 Tax=Metarhizium album (strain ARSEF 1941) TaxID=1081103 RepID=A0A0B2X4T2_METAS|nr:uncharacterized protein MAM_02214 [Metarhizium album ARSEF 1941]KHO00291.1 hypothetical protein MAM_02214 [Metarhizium album ARSEF 1941]